MTELKKRYAEEFRKFIAAVHRDDATGETREPYQWQMRLMLFVASNQHWPDRIAAPTASGKTCVTDIHTFLNSLAGLKTAGDEEYQWVDESLARIPRRLVLTVNRRSLVDDQYEEATRLHERLLRDADTCPDSATKETLTTFRRGLRLRATSRLEGDFPTGDLSLTTFNVVKLRGGMGSTDADSNWRYYPQTCAVICATPDMFGSRLLFRGYGTSRAARPIEAGLLAYDTVLVADEAHLSRQLVLTARQVKRIETFTNTPLEDYVSPLQVVSTTATQSDASGEDDGTVVSVEGSDFEKDMSLKQRLARPKPTHYVATATKRSELQEQMAQKCLELIRQLGDTKDTTGAGTIGCIVNTVTDAIAIKKQLSTMLRKEGITRPVECYVGPMREYDKRHSAQSVLRTARGDDLNLDAESIPCCVIGTQTFEVGVDADFAAMVTELAPAAALVQRTGRVNRRGLRNEGPVFIYGMNIDSDDAKSREKEAGPYRPDDLDKTVEWFSTLPAIDSDGVFDMCAWAVLNNATPPPAETPRRLLYQRLEISDVENLSHTDENLAADINDPNLQQSPSDVSLWLRDDLNDDAAPGIAVAVRQLPADSITACQLLEMAPPTADELFPVRSMAQIYGAKDSIKALLPQDKENGTDNAEIRRVFCYDASADEGNRVHCYETASSFHAQQGDVIILDDSAKAFNRDMHVFDPAGDDAERDVFNETRSGVYVVSAPADDPRINAFRDNQQTRAAAASVIFGADDDYDEEETTKDDEDDDSQKDLLDILRMYTSLSGDFGTLELQDGNVFTDFDENDEEICWIVISEQKALSQSSDIQEITVGEKKTVLLQGADGHEGHVAMRAKHLAAQIGLPDEIAQALYDAGWSHDEGKKDRRFQTLLRYGRPRKPGKPYWAKSYFVAREYEIRYRAQNGLRGWRHEQRSVAEYLAAVCGEPRSDSPELSDSQQLLIARLVGTSHGHGRSTFDHTAKFLIPDETDVDNPHMVEWAKRLFDAGEWETIIDITNTVYGFWGVSFLEALLRAADITASMEGH